LYSFCYFTGICYGFQVMKYHESPDVPFTLLRTRFTKGFYSNQLYHTGIELSISLSEDVYKAAKLNLFQFQYRHFTLVKL